MLGPSLQLSGRPGGKDRIARFWLGVCQPMPAGRVGKVLRPETGRPNNRCMTLAKQIAAVEAMRIPIGDWRRLRAKMEQLRRLRIRQAKLRARHREPEGELPF